MEYCQFPIEYSTSDPTLKTFNGIMYCTLEKGHKGNHRVFNPPEFEELVNENRYLFK